ncbi:MAG: glutamine-hydrolyzing carbamoyl-phosphate synthase small subunit [Clostridiales bacterium]|nr:glutamine-hydrolyzing carbamoyl-phosphate synthase small subunit [Clostridiales bacterium]
MEGLLYLEDGTLFKGKGFGAVTTAVGEMVFNTGVVGYQELMSDPACIGQILCMTYPLIGNAGVCTEGNESDHASAAGLVVGNICHTPSNYKSEGSLEDWMAQRGMPGVSDVDTRALTRKIREKGAMKCVISTEGISLEKAMELCKDTWPELGLMKNAGTKEYKHIPGTGSKVAVLDLGVRKSHLQILIDNDCDIHIFPYGSTADQILAVQPDGLFISSGPGDPRAAVEAVETVRKLMDKLPIFGVSMGHQVIALALGAKVFKLKYGHRGSNHGVLDKILDRSFIVSQHHGYAVEAESLVLTDGEVTHVNLNDGTVEGLRHRTLPVFSVQFSPEPTGGTKDSAYLVEHFLDLMKGGEK